MCLKKKADAREVVLVIHAFRICGGRTEIEARRTRLVAIRKAFDQDIMKTGEKQSAKMRR